MKNFTYLSLFALLLFSCKKETNRNSSSSKIIVSGKIVTDCAGTPFANQNFVLLKKNTAFIGNNRKEVAFSTDNEGNFKAEFPPTDFGSEVFIRIGNSGGGSILSFNSETDLNIGTLNTSPEASYQIKIKVNNPYSLGDTLRIGNYNGVGFTSYKFPAPLSDTILNVAYNYSNGLQIPTFDHINKVQVRSSPLVYSGIMGTSSFTYKMEKNLNFYLDGCQSNVQDVIVTID
ncbi:MAG: hypothetical protein ABF242_10585 [Flavobacteriales bacterium]